MKIASVIAKILTALATIAGAVYVIATYGDKIVAWAKQALPKCECEEEIVDAEAAEEAVEEIAEEAEEVVEDVVDAVEEIAEEIVEAVSEEEVVADEADFEG